MDANIAASFWHNFRLTRSRLRGLSKADRLETYAILRGGIILAGARAALSTISTVN